MKKLLSVIMIALLMLSLGACSDDMFDVIYIEDSTQATEGTETIENISVHIPQGWICDKNIIESSKGSFFVRMSGTSQYLWVRKSTDEKSKEMVASSEENYIEDFCTNSISWTGKEDIVRTTINDTVIVVISSGCDFSDSTVQEILGSLTVK